MNGSGATEFDIAARKKCFLGALICIGGMVLSSLIIIISINTKSGVGGVMLGFLFLLWTIYAFIVMMKVVLTGKDFEFMNRY